MTLNLVEERPWAIPDGDRCMLGSVAVPPLAPVGVALMAADRGCSRQCSSRRAVARALRRTGFATVMVDVIAPEELSDEAGAAALRIEPTELERRVHRARSWAQGRFTGLPMALVGFDGAGPAVLQEAADRPEGLCAVVVDSRFPDLATRLSSLRAPVLFICESSDVAGLAHVGAACDGLRCEYGLATVPGPRTGVSALARAEAMGRNAAAWLISHLPGAGDAAAAQKIRALPRRAG